MQIITITLFAHEEAEAADLISFEHDILLMSINAYRQIDPADEFEIGIEFSDLAFYALFKNPQYINGLKKLATLLAPSGITNFKITKVSFEQETMHALLSEGQYDVFFQTLLETLQFLSHSLKTEMPYICLTGYIGESADAEKELTAVISTLAVAKQRILPATILRIDLQVHAQYQLRVLHQANQELAQADPNFRLIPIFAYEKLKELNLQWYMPKQRFPADVGLKGLDHILFRKVTGNSYHQMGFINKLNNYVNFHYKNEAITLSVIGICGGLSILWMSMRAQGEKILWFWQMIDAITCLPTFGPVDQNTEVEYFINFVAWLQSPSQKFDAKGRQIEGQAQQISDVNNLSEYKQWELAKTTELFSRLDGVVFIFTNQTLADYILKATQVFHSVDKLYFYFWGEMLGENCSHVTACLYDRALNKFIYYDANNEGEQVFSNSIDVVNGLRKSLYYPAHREYITLSIDMYQEEQNKQVIEQHVSGLYELLTCLPGTFVDKFILLVSIFSVDRYLNFLRRSHYTREMITLWINEYFLEIFKTLLATQVGRLIWLLSSKELPINLPEDVTGKTALMYAIEANQFVVVRKLVSMKADLNIIDAQGRRALDYAAGKPRIIALLRRQLLVRRHNKHFPNHPR